MLFGIPYPGAFVCDADGKVTGRFFMTRTKSVTVRRRYWIRHSAISVETIMHLSRVLPPMGSILPHMCEEGTDAFDKEWSDTW